MPSRIQELLAGRDDRIDYGLVIRKHPWIIEKDHSCVLSPDSDGLLCGLLMSHYLGWKIAGFYDGKIGVISNDCTGKNPIFLDMEIYRSHVRSVGHHMLLYNKRRIPQNWGQFDNCIQPNNMRMYDGKNAFRLKYPLATIHLLLGIVSYKHKNIKIPSSAVPPLFFTDGVFNVLFSYPENVLNWLTYLRIDEDWHPLNGIFVNNKDNINTLMKRMDAFFKQRDGVSVQRERGDRLRISSSRGTPENIAGDPKGPCRISSDAKTRVRKFLDILSSHVGWAYQESDWVCWENMKLYRFTKSAFDKDQKSLNNRNFDAFIAKNPLSWAMTSGANIEYTLEEPDALF